MSPTTWMLILALFFFRIYKRLTFVPEEVAERDVAVGDYARNRIIYYLAYLGKWFGFGEVVPLARSLQVLLYGTPVSAEYPGIKITEERFEGVRVKIYTPEQREENGPALVWAHGGCWCMLSADDDDFLVAEICKRGGLVGISIDYRLAPEHPFPVPLHDCVKAAKHFLNNAESYGVDPNRIAMGGCSAGGNLAVAVCLAVRDEGHPRQFALQLPLIPMLQVFNLKTPSYDKNEDDGCCPKSWFVNCWMWYALGKDGNKLGDAVCSNKHIPSQVREEHKSLVSVDLLDRKYVPDWYSPPTEEQVDEKVWEELKDVILDPLYAPLMSKSFKGLPPAYIVTAGVDVLRDEGMIYARRLEKDGIPVAHHYYDNIAHPHVVHAFPHSDISKKVLSEMMDFVKEKL